MSTFTNTMTVETRPAFALPVYGPAFGMSVKDSVFGTGFVGSGAGVCSVWGIDAQPKAIRQGRDRHVTALVKGAFPGTSAWRPPNC